MAFKEFTGELDAPDDRRIDPAVQAERDVERLRIVRAEFDNATDEPTRAALGRELETIKPGASAPAKKVSFRPFDGPLDGPPSAAGAGRGDVNPPLASQARTRGGLAGEGAKPFVGGDERIPQAPPSTTVFDKPLPQDLQDAPLTPTQGISLSRNPDYVSPEEQIARYRDTSRSAEARPFTPAQNIAQDVREFTANPVARGAVAGFSQLGQTGIGAVRLAADLAGAKDAAEFAQGASRTADAIGNGAAQGLTGNDKLVSDVTSSIINSLPAVALGMAGGPALKTLFTQSALAEYNNGRDAGFDVGPSLQRAGIYGFAEAIGERFGFPEQIKLLKGAMRGMPNGDVAKAFGAMIAKEIPGEQLTTAMEFLADKIGPAALKPNATIADYLEAAGETLKVTVAQTAVMGGGPAALSTARNEFAKADAATTRSAQSVPERAARDKGFLRPTEQRKAALDQFDDYVAEHAMPPALVKAIKAQADTVPLAKLPGFFERATEALAKRGLWRGPSPASTLGERTVTAGEQKGPRGTTPGALPAADLIDDGGGLADRVSSMLEQQVRTSVDDGAHAAATSPENDLAEPTDGQKAAGNYKVGRARIAGLDLSIENPEGSVRRGVDADGTPWENTMRAHYGYVRGSEAKDGDHVDAFIKPGTPEDYAGPVFVVDQIDPKTGKYDEAKAIIGAASQEEAEAIYRSNYAPDWQGLGAITSMPAGAFRAWVTSKEARKPLGDINAARTAIDAGRALVDARRSNRGAGVLGERGVLADNAGTVDAQTIPGRSADELRSAPANRADALNTPAAAPQSNQETRNEAQAAQTPAQADKPAQAPVLGPPDVTWTGVGKKGMLEHAARQQIRDVAKRFPGHDWTVVKAPEFGPYAFKLEGRKQSSEQRSAKPVAESPSPRQEASDGGVAPAQAGTAPNTKDAAPKAKPGRLTPIEDPRVKTAEGRASLEAATANIGWDQVGGRVIRSGTAEPGDGGMGGAVVGRTPWIGSDLWRHRPEQGGKISEADAKAAIRNALAGKPMTERQKRFVQYALDRSAADEQARAEEREKNAYAGMDPDAAAEAEAERQAIMAENDIEPAGMESLTDDDIEFDFTPQKASNANRGQDQASLAPANTGEVGQDAAQEPGAAAETRSAAPGAEEGLTAPTAESLSAAESRAAAATKAAAAEQKRLADRAKADAERGEFTLTGSNNAADIAAAAGQQDIFAEKQAKPERPPEVQREIELRKRLAVLNSIRKCLGA